jgi:hypothetical protein
VDIREVELLYERLRKEWFVPAFMTCCYRIKTLTESQRMHCSRFSLSLDVYSQTLWETMALNFYAWYHIIHIKLWRTCVIVQFLYVTLIYTISHKQSIAYLNMQPKKNLSSRNSYIENSWLFCRLVTNIHTNFLFFIWPSFQSSKCFFKNRIRRQETRKKERRKTKLIQSNISNTYPKDSS